MISIHYPYLHPYLSLALTVHVSGNPADLDAYWILISTCLSIYLCAYRDAMKAMVDTIRELIYPWHLSKKNEKETTRTENDGVWVFPFTHFISSPLLFHITPTLTSIFYMYLYSPLRRAWIVETDSTFTRAPRASFLLLSNLPFSPLPCFAGGSGPDTQTSSCPALFVEKWDGRTDGREPDLECLKSHIFFKYPSKQEGFCT